MNIGFYFECSKKSGGVYQYALNLLETFKENSDHSYTIFTLSPDFPAERFDLPNWEIIDLIQQTKAEEKQKAAEIRKPSFRRKINLTILSILRKLHLYKIEMLFTRRNAKRRAEQFAGYGIDLMFYHGPSELSFLTDIPGVVAIHDIAHRSGLDLPEFSELGQKEKREYIYKSIHKNAFRILVDSPATKEDLNTFYKLPEEKITLIPLLPQPSTRNIPVKEEIQAVKSKYKLPETFLYYPAQFWPHKNHKTIAEALEILKKKGIRISLVMTGSKQEIWGEFERVAEYVRKAGLEDQFIHIGFVDEKEIPVLYHLAKALIIPDLLGSSKLSIAEAWQAGCPVIASDIRGIKEQAGNAAILVNPRNASDIAEKIENLISDSSLRAELVEKGKKKAELNTIPILAEKINGTIADFKKENENKDVIEIKDKGEVLAIFFSRNMRADGVRFLTPLHYPLQVGLLEHEHGKNVGMHLHRDFNYKVDTTQELLYVEKGQVDVKVANKEWKVIKELTLSGGDFILFTGAAHSVNIHKKSRIIEIKQGPYPGDKRAKIIKK